MNGEEPGERCGWCGFAAFRVERLCLSGQVLFICRGSASQEPNRRHSLLESGV
jgi:hypothetical protein